MIDVTPVENIINEYCLGCEDKDTYNCTSDCIFNRIKATLRTMSMSNESNNTTYSFEKCPICRAKKGKSKEIFCDDGRGGLIIADYCPACGRKINN